MSEHCYKRLHMVALTKGYHSHEEAREAALIYYRENFRTTGISFGIESRQLSVDTYLMAIYDVYFINTLGFFDYIRHIFRKLLTTINMNFGKKIRLIIVEPDGSNTKFTPMDGTLHFLY